MANSNTSLNGYEFGRSPRTTTPFWGGSSEAASIDDTGIYTDKTWSSKKISDELAKKAEASDLANYAKATAVYTKTQTYTKEEVNELLENIPSVDAYTKTQTDTLLADKADKSDTYTKSQVNNLIPDVSGLATKTELNSGLATKANSDDVYSKSQTYTKTEVDNLIADIPAVDAYTKTQTDTLLADKANVSDLANYAKSTAVYTKSQTYTKAEVDNLISGVTPTPVDAYTKAQTDNLLADKADSSDVYTKTQTDNLLADKANSADVYTKTQTDNLLADKANSSDVYSKSQTYTKSEVDNLISGAGGGAKIDDTAVAANKVWSSSKTRDELLKAAGLEYTTYIHTKTSLIRAKISGSATSIRNAMQEQFSADYQYSLSDGTVTVSIMYADGTAGQTYTINLVDIPWNDVASAEYDTNYPSDNSRWKTIVATEDIFEICIGGNVSGSSGYYYPYIFVRVPKGTYASSISLSANLGNNKWSKAGSVAVINGYVSDPTVPIWTYDISSMVTSNLSAFSILSSILPAQLVSHFKRDVASVQKINKIVIEATATNSNGAQLFYKATLNVKTLRTILPYSSSYNMEISRFVLDFDRGAGVRWLYDQPDSYSGTLYKITETVPSSSGNITGTKVSDTTTTLDALLFGFTESWTSWTMKFYQ